jgi:serine/threonine-protein kinase RsbW
MEEGFTLIDSLSIPSELNNLPVVESMIDKACQAVGIDEDMYGNVLIAVTEAVNNAIIHGNALEESKEVRLEFYETVEGFGFRICDQGQGFDHSHLPDPTAPENIEKENGRGIFLMRNLADEVLFNDQGNEVSVFFNR